MRRRLLAAALVACAAASVGAQRAKPRGMVRAQSFFSKSLGVEKQFLVYLPPSYGRSASRRYPVAYYLHGLFGGEADWVAKGGIDLVADSLMAAGMPEAIIVMPDGDGWYTTWANPISYDTCADTLHVEAPARYCVRDHFYDEYVGRDLVSYIDSHFRTKADRAPRHRRPEHGRIRRDGRGVRYAGGAEDRLPRAVSPLFRNGYGALARERSGDARSRAEERRHSVAGALRRCRYGRRAARSESRVRLGADASRRPHGYHEYPGAHTWRFWNDHVRQSLPWMMAIIGR